jgi:hypothetical protein
MADSGAGVALSTRGYRLSAGSDVPVTYLCTALYETFSVWMASSSATKSSSIT